MPLQAVEPRRLYRPLGVSGPGLREAPAARAAMRGRMDFTRRRYSKEFGAER